MKATILMLSVGLLFLLVACSNGTNEVDETYGVNEVDEINETNGEDGISDTNDVDEENGITDDSDSLILSWQTITATEAHNMMEEMDNFILLDVRTEEEFREMRIEGALLIPYDEIKNRAEAELLDKNSVILIYCRSGRRSALAAADLAVLGYTNVYDFGGIIDWSYESISD